MAKPLKFFTNVSIIIAILSNVFIAKASGFSDIQNQIAKECISQLAERKLIKGYADKTFRPQSTINRAEFAVLLLNSFPDTERQQSSIKFKDVPTIHWAYKPIQAAYERGFFTGYPDGTFRPSEPIPRVQAIAILGKHLFLSIPEEGYNRHNQRLVSIPDNPETTLKKHFDDVAQIPNYAHKAVAAATTGRIVVNYPKVRQLQPNKSTTRGEIAAIICQSLNLARTVPIEYIPGGKAPFDIPPEMGGHNDFSEGLAGARFNAKYGFMNKNGELVILAKFDDISRFSSGLAAVKVANKWGYIDKIGKLVIPTQFLQPPANFKEEVAKVTLEDKIGFIDKTGKLLFTVAYPGGKSFEVNDFSEGLAKVKIDSMKTGFIDKTGKFIIQPQADEVSDFSSGLAVIKVKAKYGYIDKTGKLVIEPQFNEAKPFYEGLAAVKITEAGISKWGYIDTTGKTVITPQFSGAENFAEGLGLVWTEEGLGYIDKTGKLIISASQLAVGAGDYIFQLGSFSSGLAKVEVGYQGQKLGYIDRNGTWIIKPVFSGYNVSEFGNFRDGMAMVGVGVQLIEEVKMVNGEPTDVLYRQGGKWGYIRSPLQSLK
jgi:hypothetical protein